MTVRFPNFNRDTIKSFTSKTDYLNEQYVTYGVQGQKVCGNSAIEKALRKCEDFKTLLATGKVCDNPTSAEFDRLAKTTSSGFCNGEKQQFICKKTAQRCPARKLKSEYCCILVKCENTWSFCKLKISATFIKIASIIKSTQKVPLGTTDLTIMGEGFNDDSKSIPIICLDISKIQISCSVVSGNSKVLNIKFTPPLNKKGAVFAYIRVAMGVGTQERDQKVQVCEVRGLNLWDYKNYFLVGAVFLLILVLAFCRRGRKTMPPAVVPGNVIYR